jgi:glucosamine-6-phosphate deaminase
VAYDRRIADAGGVNLFAVAIGGGDGHVVLDPPGTLRESYTRIVEFADTTRRDNLGIFPKFALDAVSTHGVSVGLVTAAAAWRLDVVVPGAGEQQAFARLVGAGGFDPSWPATFVYDHAQVRVWADAAAATGNVVDPLGVPHQIATEQDEE